MDGQSAKTTERGGTRGFDGHKWAKGRKRHILVDTLGMSIASCVEPANISDRKTGFRLLGGLRFAFPDIRFVIADAGCGPQPGEATLNDPSQPSDLECLTI
jgi:putative transposase